MGFDSLDLVVEAVFENLEVKQNLFAELGQVVRPDCFLATNTSSLDVDSVQSKSSHGERSLGLHFFSPAHVMRLVEVVRGRQTSPLAVASAMSLVKRMGKVGVVCGNATRVHRQSDLRPLHGQGPSISR